jgi:hypothetical protein
MNQARWPLGDSQALLTQSTHLQNENRMTRIVGLDVSKSSVSCCLLTEKPDNRSIKLTQNYQSLDTSGQR